MNSTTVRNTEQWRRYLVEHKRKTKWTCACGWDGREVDDPDDVMYEHEWHLAKQVVGEIKHYEGKLHDILRNLYAFEERGPGMNIIHEPRYQLTFRNNASISSGSRGRGSFGASITALYFRPEESTILVGELKHNGHRWTVVPSQKAPHGEVRKLQERIGTDVWQEPE